MTTVDVQHLNDILRPAAPPRVMQDLYTEDHYQRMVRVLRQRGPWPTIGAHHFNTIEELVATSNGGSAANVDVTGRGAQYARPTTSAPACSPII